MNPDNVTNSTINADGNETENLIDQLNEDLGPDDQTEKNDQNEQDASVDHSRKQPIQVIHFNEF